MPKWGVVDSRVRGTICGACEWLRGPLGGPFDALRAGARGNRSYGYDATSAKDVAAAFEVVPDDVAVEVLAGGDEDAAAG